MTIVDKRLDLVRRRPDIPAEQFAREVLERVGPALLEADPRPVRLSVDLAQPGQELLARRGLRTDRSTYDAAVWRWYEDGDASERAGVPDANDLLTPALSFRLEEHVGWEYDRDWPDGTPTPGVKQISMLAAAAGYGTDEFRRHYRHHVALTRKHMPAVWRYVQNDVAAGSGEESEGVVAVSELYFRSVDDFLERYFPTEEDRRTFVANEGFLDLPRAFSVICFEHLLESGPGRPATR
jgi:hypothetical protein